MNMKKIVTITIIAIFAVGILCGAAEASHTFKKGGYKMTVTDKQYKNLKNAGKYKTVTKTVTKKKVSYKTVEKERYRSYYDNDGYLYKTKTLFPADRPNYSGQAVKVSTYTKLMNKVVLDNGDYYQDEVVYDKWKFTKNYKVKVKQKKFNGGYQITKKVGTTNTKTYGTKTKKFATVRVYYTAYGASAGKKLIYKNTKKYGTHMGNTMKIVKTHYNPDGTYYVDVAAYAKWKTTKKVKTPVYMCVSHDERMGHGIQVEVYTRDGPLY